MYKRCEKCDKWGELTKPKILVLLQDNPKTKSKKAFTYQKDINTADYFSKVFHRLHDCIEDIAKEISHAPEPIEQSWRMGQLGQLEDGKKKTLALLIENTANLAGMEIGQTEERKIYIRQLPPKVY